MKKKLAVLLALCLMLGALPLSALAATYKLTTADGVEVGTLTTNDETGAYEATNLTGDFAAYSIAPGTIKVGDKTATLEATNAYSEAPGTLQITATLVEEEEPFEEITVSFQGGDGTGTMENVTVSTQAEADAWVLPHCTFTAPTDKVFAGWKLSTDNGENPTLYDEGAAYSLTENVTFVATWKASEIKIDEDGKLVVENEEDLTAGDTVAVNAGETETVTIPADTLTKLDNAQVEAIEVQNHVASVTVSIDTLKELKAAGTTAPQLTIKTGSATGTVKASVKVELTGVPEAGAAKQLKTPIEITVNVEITGNPFLAYLNEAANKWIRARGDIGSNSVTFRTRHLTEFAVVESADPDQLISPKVSGNGTQTAGIEFSTEPGERVQIAYEMAKGTEKMYTHKAYTPGVDATTGLGTVQDDYTAPDGWTTTVVGAVSVNGALTFSNETGFSYNNADLMAQYAVAGDAGD